MEHLLETAMLVCFGLSWPMAVIKNIKSGTAKGMSLPFILMITFGYIAGISAKILSNNINYVLIAYFINIAFVSFNILVYFRNLHLDKVRENGATVSSVNQVKPRIAA